MKTFNTINIVLLGLLALSCAKSEKGMLQEINGNKITEYFKLAEEPVFEKEHDNQMNELAKALSQAVRENDAVRSFIHSEALLRFDGDYDFLISKTSDKPIELNAKAPRTRSVSGNVSFGDVVREYLPETKGGTDLLSALQEQYPDLQIAVPVHAEEWNPETYIPVVAFLPEDYDDAITQAVPGYNAEGEYVEVDAVNPPDVPVIVLSHNERLDRFEPRRPINHDLLATPTNLVGSTTDIGIALSWHNVGEGLGYKVWRKGPEDVQFIRIATVQGLLNTGYQDLQASSGVTYQYYVTSYDLSDESLPSNIVTVTGPEVTEPLASFQVIPSGLQVECMWTRGQVSYADVIIEHKGPYDSSYSTLCTISDWSTNYCFTPSYRGRKHTFRAYRDNGNSQSDALTGFIYPPYRNTNEISNVYIKKIEYPLGLEGWLRGNADFDIVVVYYDTFSGSIKSDHFYCEPTSGEDLSLRIRQWRCHNAGTDWYSMMTIFINEQDSGAAINMSLDVTTGYEFENDISTQVVGHYTFDVKDEDDPCGSVDLFYYDNPEQIIPFQNEGVVVTISQNP